MEFKQFLEISKERQYNSLRRTCDKLGYDFYEKGDYNLNIIAIRNVDDINATKFNDVVVVAYLIDGIKTVDVFKATTDPGLTYRRKPINRKGTAIVVPQQVRGGLTIGKHKGYTALVQKHKFDVIRDNDRNDKISELAKYTMSEIDKMYITKSTKFNNSIIYDKSGNKIANIEYGMFGINFHRASKWRILDYVGLYSAGCIVQQDPYRFQNEFMKLIHKSANRYGSIFTMTLITNDKLY